MELVRRGENFAGMSETSRSRIAEIGHSFVQDGCTVLTHGSSRVVMALLLKAAAESKQFKIIVTEAGPTGVGYANIRSFLPSFPVSLLLLLSDKLQLKLMLLQGSQRLSSVTVPWESQWRKLIFVLSVQRG
jgi:hypothetical protein